MSLRKWFRKVFEKYFLENFEKKKFLLKIFRIYLSLAGIGELDKDAISCEFTQGSFDLKIQGYKNKNHR